MLTATDRRALQGTLEVLSYVGVLWQNLGHLARALHKDPPHHSVHVDDRYLRVGLTPSAAPIEPLPWRVRVAWMASAAGHRAHLHGDHTCACRRAAPLRPYCAATPST